MNELVLKYKNFYMTTKSDRIAHTVLSFCSIIEVQDLTNETRVSHRRIEKEHKEDKRKILRSKCIRLSSGATFPLPIPGIKESRPKYPKEIIEQAEYAVPKPEEINADEIPLHELRTLIYIIYGVHINQGTRESLKTAFHSLIKHNYYKAKKVAMLGQKIHKKDGWIYN